MYLGCIQYNDCTSFLSKNNSHCSVSAHYEHDTRPSILVGHAHILGWLALNILDEIYIEREH